MLLLIFSFSIPTNDNKFFKFATIMEIFKNYYGFFFNNLLMLQASLVAQLVKNLPEMQETPVWFLGREDPLEKG